MQSSKLPTNGTRQLSQNPDHILIKFMFDKNILFQTDIDKVDFSLYFHNYFLIKLITCGTNVALYSGISLIRFYNFSNSGQDIGGVHV